MAIIVMDMSGYGRDPEVSLPETGSGDAMRSDWGPALEIATDLPAKEWRHTIIDAGLVDADIDVILDKMIRIRH